MPLKTAIVPLIDVLDKTAIECGSVNTVKIQDGKFIGYNTDGVGFINSLNFDPKGLNCVIFGKGGAAQSIDCALRKSGANVSILSIRDEIPAFRKCDILVNATPLGMDGLEFSNFNFLKYLNKNTIVYDLVYKNQDTKLIKNARTKGFKVFTGLDLLASQAIESFKIWTEKDVSLDFAQYPLLLHKKTSGTDY